MDIKIANCLKTIGKTHKIGFLFMGLCCNWLISWSWTRGVCRFLVSSGGIFLKGSIKMTKSVILKSNMVNNQEHVNCFFFVQRIVTKGKGQSFIPVRNELVIWLNLIVLHEKSNQLKSYFSAVSLSFCMTLIMIKEYTLLTKNGLYINGLSEVWGPSETWPIPNSETSIIPKILKNSYNKNPS